MLSSTSTNTSLNVTSFGQHKTTAGGGGGGGDQLSTTPTNTSLYGLVSHNNVSSAAAHNTYSFMCDRNDTSFFRTQMSSIKGYYKLSLGRIYHELFYVVDESTKTDYVRVEIYKPKEKKDKFASFNSNSLSSMNGGVGGGDGMGGTLHSNKYKYRFQVPDSKTYDISYCEMSRRNIETIKWNDIDSYICIQGLAFRFFSVLLFWTDVLI